MWGIIQTLRNAVFGENLALPPPLVTVRNVSNVLRNVWMIPEDS